MERNCRRIFALTLALAVAGLLHAPARGQAADPAAYGDDYGSGDFGRVTYQENGVVVTRAHGDPAAAPVSEVGINSPIYPGDALTTAPNQRAEIQLAGGSLVRVDRGSEVTFLSLPDPYATISDHTVLQVAEGTIRIAALLSGEDEFRIDTPAATIYLLGDGDFRVEVRPGGRTEVVSRRGVAELVGEGGSILVRGGMRSEVLPGTLPEEPWAFNTFVTDGFDRWVEEREAIYLARESFPADDAQAAQAYESLPQEVRPYYQELSAHGEWVYTDELGYVWRPGSVPSGWRPYHDGYWDYGPGGWFWVSYEPWGWAPYHWGRWNWYAGYGWCWAPGSVFGGAWVAWSWGSAYLGWAPLDYWGWPCWVRPVHYYGYYDPYCWTFVSYPHVAHRDTRRYAVPVDRVGDDLRRATVVLRAPRVAPGELATSRDARVRAMRSAEADTAARMRAVEPGQERARGRSLRDLERSMEPRAAQARRETDRGEDRSVGAPGRRFASYERRISAGADRGATGSRLPVGTRNEERRGAERSGSAAGRTTPPAGEPKATGERVRDLYRRVGGAQQDRSGSPERRASPGARDGAPGRREAAERSSPDDGRSGRQPSARPSKPPVRRGESASPGSGSRRATPPERDRRGGGGEAARRPAGSSAAPRATGTPTRAEPGSTGRSSAAARPRSGPGRTVNRAGQAPPKSPAAGSRSGGAPSKAPAAGSRSGGRAPSKAPAAGSRSGGRAPSKAPAAGSRSGGGKSGSRSGSKSGNGKKR